MSRRLPLLVASIVVCMMATVLSVAFQRVHRLAIETAVAHLEASSHQLVSTLQSAATRVRREAVRTAGIPELGKAFGAFASGRDIESARRVIASELQRIPSPAAISLWSREGQRLLSVGDTALARIPPPPMPETADSRTLGTGAMIAPLVLRGDSIFFAVSAPIGGPTTIAGYVVVTRTMSNNPQALQLLRGLVGPEARILIGNAGENAWTDFSRRVDVSVAADSGTGEHTAADGVAYLHAIEGIPGTPWRIMVDLPQRWATVRAGRFVLEMVGVAGLLITIGTFVLWQAVRRSLRPLGDVTDAVVTLARGGTISRVRVDTDDELRQLADAFNSMADQVQTSTRELAARADALEASNRELQDSENRYRGLVDHLPDGIVVHRDRTVSFANRAAARLFGASEPRDLLGRSVLDLVDPADRSLVARRTEQVQSSGRPAETREIRVARANGKPRLVEVTSMRLSVGGQNAVQTIMHDVTERRLLEEQLRQSQKMDAVGRLAGGVSHDFNNILTVIEAHAEFARRPDAPEKERLADIEEIRKASASAARLTKQLLAFSRKHSISPVRIDLNATVRNLLGMLRRLIGERVQVSADLADPLWPVRADASQMEQIVMNLSVNARDAMPRGGTLSFMTSNVHAGPDYRTGAGERIPSGDYVLLTVEDSGIGMTPEVQSRIFEPFFTTKQPGQGTGLGLSTVYGIVKQSGGFLWVYSEPARGSAFKILLPRYIGDDEDRPELTRTSEHRLQALKASILLVEDQEAVRAAIARGLWAAGFTVHEASNAEQAEKFLRGPEGGEVSLVVTDMVMPGTTGAEFAASPLVVDRDIPVIIMSGYSEEFTNREWRVPPNAVFMDKPVSPSDLIRLIARLIG